MANINSIGSNNYITIQGWMRTQLDLSGNELIAMALIYGFSQDGESAFIGSMSYIADWIGVSRRTAIRVVESLVKKGYVKKTDVVRNNVKFCNYTVTDLALKAKNGGCVKMTQGVTNCHRGVCQNDTGCDKLTQGGYDKMTHHIDRIHIDSTNTNNTYIANSADATFAGADRNKSAQDQSAVDVDSSLSTEFATQTRPNPQTPFPSAKTQETVIIDKTAMLKKGNVFNPAAYALVANLAKKLGSHEGKASKKVLIALRSVITSNPKLVENNCDLFMKCAEQLASDNYQVNLGNNNVEFLLNHISKYLNLAAKGGVQTNDPSEGSKSKSIWIKY